MTSAFTASIILLWVIVITLTFVVLALARQVGVLHERVAPAGALQPTSGPKVGELTDSMLLKNLKGNEITIGGTSEDDYNLLVMFISPTCPVCKSLVPTVQSLAKSEKKRIKLLFASDGDNLTQHKAYANDLSIDHSSYVVSEALGISYEVSKLPFALLIANDGTLKSKGLVNTREHLESLIEAMDTGIATLQEYIGNNNQNNDQLMKEKAS